MPVKIDKSRDGLLKDYAVGMLKDFYLNEYEDSPQEGFRRAATAWSNGDEELAQRLYDYVSNKWFKFASPVLSNPPNGHGQGKGMPIS